MASRLVGPTYRLATCWAVERTDGVVIRVTNHNADLTVQGHTYKAANSFQSTAADRQGNFKDRNIEIVGVVDIGYVSDEDLRAGKFQDARVIELIVDWMVPWAGIFSETHYYIKSASWSGEMWEVQLVGMSDRLSRSIGDIYTKTCRWDLGESAGTTKPGCHIDLTLFDDTGTITYVSTQRRSFKTSLTSPDFYFSRGQITFTSGNNLNLTFEAQSYYKQDGKVVLFLDTPFDLAIGDAFRIVAGCDKTMPTCIAKFGNILNFGGFPFIPGTDRMMRTPTPKAS